MAIEVSCDECATTFRVRDEAAGKQVKCKGCGAVVRVPREAPPPPHVARRRTTRSAAPGRKAASGSGSSALLIVGGVAGALMVVGLGLFFLLRGRGANPVPADGAVAANGPAAATSPAAPGAPGTVPPVGTTPAATAPAAGATPAAGEAPAGATSTGAPASTAAAPSAQFDKILNVGTDGATLYIFHPQDLQHRKTSPMGWENYTFAARPEYEAGRLIHWSTGGDGGYRIRATSGDLTEREKKYGKGSFDCRLLVTQNRLLFDGGDSIPSSDQYRTKEDARNYLDLPNGKYKVTIHGIDWYDEPGATDKDGNTTPNALPSYVARFQPVADLSTIPVPGVDIRLESSGQPYFGKGSEEYENARYLERREDIPAGKMMAFEIAPTDALCLGSFLKVKGDEALNQKIFPRNGEGIDFAIASVSTSVPCLGAIVRFGGASGRDGAYEFSAHVLALVTVRSMKKTAMLFEGTYEFLNRPAESPSAEDIASLKSLYAGYAKADAEFRKNVREPDWEAECASHMTDPAALVNRILSNARLPEEKRRELLPLSDAKRAEELHLFLGR